MLGFDSVCCMTDVGSVCFLFFFFFQAEDGIRDLTVTGVQTCALPISEGMVVQRQAPVHFWGWADDGEPITVRFLGQTATTTARDGRWSVTLKPVRNAGDRKSVV